MQSTSVLLCVQRWRVAEQARTASSALSESLIRARVQGRLQRHESDAAHIMSTQITIISSSRLKPRAARLPAAPR